MRILTFLAAIVLLFATNLAAHASDKKFFSGVRGEWSGPGEIVAGKYKGTKFVCKFGGTKPKTKEGMMVDGSCRVGVFSRPMSAEVMKTAASYVGKFLDGQKGDGMDVVGGRYTQNRLVVEIRRKNLNGIMVANLSNPNRLNITISVRHNKKLIPVIGMNLARTGKPVASN